MVSKRKRNSVPQIRMVKLIIGIIYSSDEIKQSVEKELTDSYGEIDLKSEIIKFDITPRISDRAANDGATHGYPKDVGFTDYYCDEMGKNLLRYWISFTDLVSRENIYKIKLETNNIESRHAGIDNKRKINIDPGYISGSKLVLLSTKDYSHRIYLSEGIFGEVTLLYKHGKFNILDWTYPDYRAELARNFFKTVRDRYIEQCRIMFQH